MLDVLRTTVGLSNLPSSEEIFRQFDTDTKNILRPLLSRLPLVGLLREIMNLAEAAARDKRHHRSLLDLARLAVAKHDYTRQLYSSVVEAVMTPSLDEAAALLHDLPPIDARLTMEMMALVAELLAVVESYERGVYAFQVAKLVADHFGLISNRGVVFHQLGMYQLRCGHFAEAEASLKSAADIFSRIAPDLERQTNFVRANIYKITLRFEADPLPPADLESIIAADPKSRDVISLGRVHKAIERDDFAKAERICQELRNNHPEEELWPLELLLVEARLARRKGQFEAAHIWLRRASAHEDAESLRDEISWQKFYLVRDLGQEDESRALLQELEEGAEPIRVDYQKALLARDVGENEKAEELFRRCLSRTDDDRMRADCLGMLALVASTPPEANRCLHEAIGLYVKLDRQLDHALSLSHLASKELAEGMAWKSAGAPMFALSQFTRSDNLLVRAQAIAELLGADSFLLSLIMHRARLEMERERYNVALRHFERAASLLELTYLSMTDRQRADLFIKSNSEFYLLAITCALQAERPDKALLFSERSKARRFLRDTAEAMNLPNVASTHGLFDEERKLLSTIQPLRRRVTQRRPISPDEQTALYQAEQQLRELWRRMRQVAELTGELSKRVHQPVEVPVLRQLVFGEQIAAPGEFETSVIESVDEEVQELPGGGVMQCPKCFVYNRISSTFCSACEALLPKSVVFNLYPTSEEELRSTFAENLYNRGATLFHEREIEKAEPMFKQAMEYGSHPDYSFFFGLCRLFRGDSTSALNSFQDVLHQQFSFKYPFWPLPASPSDFQQCLRLLKQDQTKAEASALCFMKACAAFSDRKREVS